MKITVLPVGMLQTNCYIVATDKKNAILIDPGANAGGILSSVEAEGLTVKYLVFTHGHFDHIGAASELRARTGAKTFVPEGDVDLWLDPKTGGSGLFSSFAGYTSEQPDMIYREGDIIELDDVRLTALHTPGHTKGSCVLIGDGYLFSGDTLFAGTCGRTDLYGGSDEEMAASMKKLAALEGDYQVLPGHGEQTTLAYERITNPWMGTNYDDIF